MGGQRDPTSGSDMLTRKRIHLPHSYLVNKAFDFVTYRPATFAQIRELCAPDASTFAASFTTAAAPADDEMIERFTEGRSGSFFYFTHDQKYLVKTVEKGDQASLDAILPYYLQHLERYPRSLLPRFLGLYAIRLSPEQRFITFIVMENVFSRAGALSPSLNCELVFDLKGSTVDRRVVPASASLFSVSGTLKDMDLRDPIAIGDVAKSAVQSQLTSDVTFLNAHNLMDYSLLLGVFRTDDNGVLSRLPSGEEACLLDGIAQKFMLKNHSNRNEGDKAEEEEVVEKEEKEKEPWAEEVGSEEGDVQISMENKRLSVGSAVVSERHRLASHSAGGAGQGGRIVYFGGIIDVLQRYTLTKRLENLGKRMLLCKDGHGISAVEPDEYALRFLRSMGIRMQ